MYHMLNMIHNLLCMLSLAADPAWGVHVCASLTLLMQMQMGGE